MIASIINTRNQGVAWVRHTITAAQVLGKNANIQEGSESLWSMTQQIVQNCQDKGYIKDS